MQMEREYVLSPTLAQLESEQATSNTLQSKLLEEKQTVKKLNTINCEISKENEQYKQGLEQYDLVSRKKLENAQNTIRALTAQIEQFQTDNEELNRKLIQCELDLYALRRQTHQSADDEEKAIEVEIIYDDNHMEKRRIEHDTPTPTVMHSSATFPDIPESQESTTECPESPIILPRSNGALFPSAFSSPKHAAMGAVSTKTNSSAGSSRKTSIVLTLTDLASVIAKAEGAHRANTPHKLDAIGSEKDLFGSLKNALLSKVDDHDVADAQNEVDGDFRLDDREEDDWKFDEVVRRKDEEIKRLRLENAELVEMHQEIQNTLKMQLMKKNREILEKKERIENLRAQKQTLEMQIAKKSCNMVPWCR